MGLAARAVEEAGIPTLTMTSALDITRAVMPPRAVFVNFPLGHQTGKPNQPELQRNIVRDALLSVDSMTKPGSVVTLPYRWADDDESWEGYEYGPGYLPAYVRSEVSSQEPKV